MTYRKPEWYKHPTVATALTWLLPPALNVAEGSALGRARILGLIRNPAPGSCEPNGIAITRLAKAALRRLPDDPQTLGDILHGLGEIAARSQLSIVEPLIAILGRRRRIKMNRVIAAAFARDAKGDQKVRPDVIAFAQWLSGTTTNWDTLVQAESYVEHGPMLAVGYYGLAFTARVTLSIDAHAIDDCIRENPNSLRLAAIGKAALAMVFPFDGKARPMALLQSRNAAIRSVGAAALLLPPEILGPPLSFRDCWAALVASGIAPSEATWMVGARIKEGIHRRYRLRDAQKNETARLRYIEKNPQSGVGGAQNTQVEISMLRIRLVSYAENLQRLLPELEGMLTNLAEDWPIDGLSNEQMLSLDNIFVGTAEFRHRLAEKLPPSQNRDWLLKQNILQLRNFVGLAETPADVRTDHFSLDESQFLSLAEWTARSLCMLYETDSRGIGKRTSDQVSNVGKTAKAVLARPFMSARKPEEWQSILTRAACADCFAFMVVAATPEAKRHTVIQLNKFALTFAHTLLSNGQIPIQASAIFVRLVASAVHNMGYDPKPDDVRESWGLDERLPDFPRALAIWSSPALVTKHRVLADDLFRRVGKLPLSQRARGLRMSEMLRLLDLAIASSAAGQRTDMVNDLVSLWRDTYGNWRSIDGTWAESAAMLAGAIAADGPERAQISEDPAFEDSYCIQMVRTFIDAAKNRRPSPPD